MAPPLAIGYSLLSLIFVSAMLVFGLPDMVVPARHASVVGSVAAASLLVAYLTLWLWMLVDHIINGEATHTVLIAFVLVLGGGLAALAYFFLVFRNRYVAQSAQATVRAN